MKTEIQIDIISALKIAHEVLQHLSEFALKELLKNVKKELETRDFNHE